MNYDPDAEALYMALTYLTGWHGPFLGPVLKYENSTRTSLEKSFKERHSPT